MFLIDGRESDSISVLDRGLHYGDGLFETMAVIDGSPWLWERHMRRLCQGARRLGLPGPDAPRLREEALRLGAGHARAVLKVIITRGRGARGYRAEETPRLTRIVARYAWPDYPAAFSSKGIQVRVCDTRLGDNPHLAGLKHLNRLEQVLARGEWRDPGIAEGLMLDQSGRVISGTQSNLFAVRGGGLCTPELSRCGIRGVMREWILEQGTAMGIPCSETALTLDDILGAEEVFMCNSVAGIWPVRGIGAARLEIGPVTRRLMAAVEESRDAIHA